MTNTIPEWMYPSECRTLSRKYGSDRLTVAMNTARAEKPVLYRWDHDEPGEWRVSPMQTADFGHRLTGRCITACYHL